MEHPTLLTAGLPSKTMTMTSGLDSNRSISSGIRNQQATWLSVAAIPHLKDLTIALSGQRMLSGAILSRNTWTICLEAGINVEGINSEVATGQWEFQIFSKGAKAAGDQVWVARYLLERTAEKYGVAINWHCKPLGATDWNGSGMHANFSNTLCVRWFKRSIRHRLPGFCSIH